MSTEHHDFMVGQNFFADEPYSVLPECSCGWEGKGVASIEDAQEAWENHCDAVFMEATTRQQGSSDGQSDTSLADGPSTLPESPIGAET